MNDKITWNLIAKVISDNIYNNLMIFLVNFSVFAKHKISYKRASIV